MELLLVFLMTLTSSANAGRMSDSKAAQNALLDLNFFYDGKGMVLPANFPPFYGTPAIDLLKSKIESYGLIVDRSQVIGYQQLPYKNFKVGVVGCAACHTGKAAGQIIPGLGNKNIDIFRLGQDAKRYLKIWDQLPDLFGDPKAKKEIRENSDYFIGRVSDERLGNLTQGLVPIGLIRRWFFKETGIEMDSFSKGQNKVPHLWGYDEKRDLGSFSDAGGDGEFPGWAIAVELVAGQSAENALEYFDKVVHAEEKFADLLPPKYPFEIDQSRLKNGLKKYNQTCFRCHGSYEKDQENLAVFRTPKFIKYNDILTDYDRLEGVTETFRTAVSVSPLNSIIKASNWGKGYVAPRLEGIWARFPYLHNGSVPDLYALLSHPNERPLVFSLRQAGEAHRFDSQSLGVNADPDFSYKELLKKGAEGERWVYDTRRVGHSSQGHYWEDFAQLTHTDKLDLIEYLKTL